MADTDNSSYILRYDFLNSSLQYFNGANWYTAISMVTPGMTQLTGDVTAGPGSGSQAATVASVGGSTASSIHTSQLLTASATASNTINTLVLRDGSGASVFQGLEVLNAGGGVTLDIKNTTSSGSSFFVAHDDSDSAQAYFGIGNATYGNVLTRHSPSIISAGLAFPLVMETQGFLPPLYTTANRDAISSPHDGLSLYNTDSHAWNYFNGTAWSPLGGGSPAGSNTQIQFNNSGSFGANAQLTFDTASNTLSLIDPSPSGVGATVILAADSSGVGPEILFTDLAHPTAGQYGTIAVDGFSDLGIQSTANAYIETNTAGTPNTFKFGVDGGLQLPPLAARPGSPVEGEVIYNSTSHHIEYYNGTTWVTL